MAEQTQAQEKAPVQPKTWQEALNMWDDGHELSLFEVESEGADQRALWGAAFDFLRGTVSQDALAAYSFTQRERDVVDSIVAVARKTPWKKFIQQHIASGHISGMALKKS